MKLAGLAAASAVYLVPGAAVLIASTILLLGRARSGVGARVHGGPPTPEGIAAWHVVAVERKLGVEVPLRQTQLALVAQVGGRESSAYGTTDDEGAWEARLPLAARMGTANIAVRLMTPQPRTIGQGVVPLGVPQWENSLQEGTLPLVGEAAGQLAISVWPTRGIFAAAYPEDVIIEVRDRTSGAPVPEATLSVQGLGARIEEPSTQQANNQGRGRLRVLPTEPEANLQVTASVADGRDGKWSGALPVVLGAIWLDPAGVRFGRASLRSPVAHRHVYVTIVNTSGRLWAARVPMSPDSGGARGEIQIPELERVGAQGASPRPGGDLRSPARAAGGWVLVSTDPPGRETGAVGWPVPSDDDPWTAYPSAAIRTPLLIDGMPQADRVARQAAMRTRIRALGVLGLAALMEAFLLWLRVSQMRLELAASLAAHKDVDPQIATLLMRGQNPWPRLILASGIIALGFFATALATWIGTTP